MSVAPETFPVLALKRLQQIESWLTCTAFFILVVVVFSDVVSRELTGSGLFWASQTGVWANVIIVMAGFGLASSEGAHLRPRFTDNWLPASWFTLLIRIQHLCMAGFCLGFGLLAARVVLGSYQLGEVSIDLFLPVWPVQLFIPAAFFAATLRHSIMRYILRCGLLKVAP